MHIGLLVGRRVKQSPIRNLARCWSSASAIPLVLGCGSNVVDQFFMVEAVPKVGEKGFFRSPNKIHEKSVVGGVTLNHLSWAALLGVPTGLLALQGGDVPGRLIRRSMKKLGISPEFLQVSEEYMTAQSYVFVQQDGERSIIMASGATSLINDKVVYEFFADSIKGQACMLSTEISQVPLSGVAALLNTAKSSNVMSILDLDVSPAVALKEAKLGSMHELVECVNTADVLKPAKHAAREMLSLLRPDIKKNLSSSDTVQYLMENTNAKMVALTAGGDPTVIATRDALVEIPTKKLDKVVDATGAGDAFLGGLITGLHFHGFPKTLDEITCIGELANKTGAACCMVLGGLPDVTSKEILYNEIEQYHAQIQAEYESDDELYTPSPDFENSIIADVDAAEDVMNLMDFKSVSKFIEIIEKCKGHILISGIGKSAIVASRMAASLASTGTPAHFVHATEWSHGDLGKICPSDVVVFFSHSGNTEEVNYAAELVKRKEVPLLGIVGSTDSPLAHMCDAVIDYVVGKDLMEPLGGAPTTSIVLQEMIVNGVICELIRRKNFTKEQFLFNHPGGSLGRKLSKKLGHDVRYM